MIAIANIIVNTIRAIKLLLENKSGKSLTVSIPRIFILPVKFSTSSAISIIAPFAGSKMIAGITINKHEITPVIMVPSKNVVRIFLNFAKFSILAIAADNEQKIRGTTQQYSKFRKRSATGCKIEEPSPQKKPIMPPISIEANNKTEDL